MILARQSTENKTMKHIFEFGFFLVYYVYARVYNFPTYN